ncbi:MAG: two-component regulator propeller domain-containing protein [Prevotellaceae bacterium]|nr:two-component regulator propeller domain-containing protein [Prevotellaceae bacterium]
MRLYILIITLVMMTAHPFCAIAQSGRLFNTDEQLSSSLVNQVYQDRQGFIWVCTANGLNRYDGYNFITYTKADGLLSDIVNNVCQDNHGNLYIGTSAGICVLKGGRIHSVFDASSNKEINSYVTGFSKSPDGALFFSTSGQGLWRITGERQATRVFEHVSGTGFVQAITFDRHGTLWVVTNVKGIFALKGDQERRFTLDNAINYAVMTTDSKDNIYIGLVNGGIYKAGPSRHGFTLIPSTANIPVTSLMPRKDGRLYIGTNGNGLWSLNPATGELTKNRLYCNEIDVNRTKVYSITQDNSGNLWLGLLQKGVFMHSPQQTGVNYMGRARGENNLIGEACVIAVYRQRNGTLWVAGDQDGLYALDSNGKLIRHYTYDPASPKSVPGTVMSITEDQQGRLWIGSFLNGCGWLDTKTGEYHRSPFSNNEYQSVFDVRIDKHNTLWVGTLGGGLIQHDLNTGRTQHHKSDYRDTTATNHLVNDFVMQLEADPSGRYLFVGTTTGLSCLDLKKKRWNSVIAKYRQYGQVSVSAIRYDRATGLWVGNSQGLWRTVFNHDNPTSCTVTHYTTANGLPSNNIAAIETDSHGMVWVSTNKGVCRLDPKTGKAVSLFGYSGLMGDEFYEDSSCRDSEGRLYFGGTMGLTSIDPLKVTLKAKNMYVAISQMLIGGEAIKAGDKSGGYEICDTDIFNARHFDLSHQDNTITIRFSTLTYTEQKNVTFKYSINGDEWITLPQGQNEITLSRLPPGDYNFRVMATSNNISSKPREFTLVIHNPWYFTPVARLIYLLIILAIGYWYFKTMQERNREKLQLQSHIHAEELNELKLRSFINLSHEIRTPMTLITTPLLQLMSEDDDSHRNATYKMIHRNAERILHIVNQIMDIRKIDKGQMTMQMQETDFVTLAEEVVHTFSPQAASKQITLSFDHPELETLPVWIDLSQFDKVLMNLMSNAIKYTPAGGRIAISLAKQEKTMTLTVFNNGKNIPEESLQRIFERFYQVPSAAKHKSGTGVGLDLTRSLVTLHHGQIIARNTPDGVEFIVTLPLGHEHLKPEEIAAHEEDGTPPSQTETLSSPNEAETMEPSDSIHAQNNSRRATIVIAEDDDEIRNYLMGELSKTYKVLAFPNGAEALPVILIKQPQLVISDVMMPKMDGHVLCTRIKSNITTNHIPVILLTAKTRDEDKLEGLETGADLYVTKPFNLDILQRNIANLIGSRKVMLNKFTGQEDQTKHIDEIDVENPDEVLISRVMSVINSNLNNSDLNIDMICGEVGISRVHLHRKMKEMTNQTPHEFIRNLRMKQAAKMLLLKNQSVTETMYRCGFNSPTSFSTTFKKIYGMSPRDYKRLHEEE